MDMSCTTKSFYSLSQIQRIVPVASITIPVTPGFGVGAGVAVGSGVGVGCGVPVGEGDGVKVIVGMAIRDIR